MPTPASPLAPASSSPRSSGPACERSSLPPWLRFAITFGVLFALKLWLLPSLGLPPVAQVLTLLVVATFFVWRFWWRCSPARRGAVILTATLWIAGVAKILMR
jgi:hypothetical protein